MLALVNPFKAALAAAKPQIGLWLGLSSLQFPANSVLPICCWPPSRPPAFSQPSDNSARPDPSFLWPAALVVFLVGAAVASLLGIFVSFAQLLGPLRQ